MDYDLIVIGGGSAGLTATAAAARIGVRVLLIEKKALMEALCVAVTCCMTPREALDLLEREAFDIVFTDIHMPEMTGFDVLREVRRRPGPNRDAPVIALTADLTRTGAQYCELGFDGFVPKPVALRPLAEVLLQCLPSKGRASAA